MNTTSRPSRLAAAAACLAALIFGLIPPAHAAPGAAPPGGERRVLSGIHTDVVAVYAGEGGLELASRADIDGSHGVRLDPDLTVFNVEESRRTTLPDNPAFAFLEELGDDVWLAPYNNPAGAALWPGLSGEDVPAGYVAGDEVTVGLEASGPGTVHLYQPVDGGGVLRLLSGSGGEHRTWNMIVGPGAHHHASWAFSAAGAYTLTFSVSAIVGGEPVSVTRDYHFIVGDVPPPVETGTHLHVHGGSTVTVGTTVELHAEVTPEHAAGYVEFRNGATVLGHEAVVDGEAELEIDSLPIGTHSITARFVPLWVNDFTASVSGAETITVTDGSGVPFSITGVAASYQPGDTLNATVVGATLEGSQQFRWLQRPIGSTATGTNVQTSTATAYSRGPLSASDDGCEISVTIRQGSTVLAQTSWVPIVVEQDGERPVLVRTLGDGPVWAGDTVRLEASGLNLGEGESLQFVQRITGTWFATGSGILNFFSFSYPEPHILEGVKITRATSGERDFAVRVIRDGLAVRQSEPVTLVASNPEIMIEGVQGLYMEGTTAALSAVVHPAREGDDLTYQWQFSKTSNFNASHPSTVVWSTDSETPLSVQHELNVADHNEGYLRLRVLRPGWTDSLWFDSVVFDSSSVRIYVTDDPNTQLFFFNNLSAHYHQGDNVNLVLTVVPDPLPDDEIVWEWKWPGSEEWLSFPGASGKTHTVKAEQALDGVQVRATLDFASDRESIVAPPVTIHVDDHGAAARQKPTIAGAEDHFHEGDTATLTRLLPENGPTVLTAHRWEKKAAGSEDWTVIEGATGGVYSFTAAVADDGAQYRVSILKPTGGMAYGPSPAVTLEVDDHEGPEPGVLAPAYRVELLEPTNGGVNAGALGINEAGDVVGITRPTTSSQPQMTVVWERHGNHFHAIELANLAGSQFSRGFDLSADRTIVGEAFNSGGNTIPIRWDQAGTPQHVTTLNEAGNGILNDIDEGGTAVGTASGKAVKVAPDGTVTVLEEPDAGVEGAVVNNYTATTIAGGVAGGRASIAIPHEGHSHNVLYGVVWDGDGARLLALPDGASNTGVFGISPDGTAVGAVTLASKETPVLWNADGTARILPIPAVSTYTHGSARSVANGVAVGYVSQFAGNTSFGGAAVAWGADGPVDLNTLTVNLPEGVTLLSASDVNSAGQIVGTARTADGMSRGFVLTPTSEEPPGPALAISGAAEHYHTGDTVTLTAVQNPPTGEDHYHWFIKPAGAAEFTVIPGALEGVYSFTAAEGHDGAEILVRLYDHDHDLLAESAPVTIHIDDHGHHEPVLTITGLGHHYHQGAIIALTVVVEPAPHEDDRIVWEWKWPGGGWTSIPGASGATFSVIAEQALDGVQVRAKLIPADEDEEPVVSAPVTLDIDDHGDPAFQVVTVAGATSCAAGDTVTLTAAVSPSTVLSIFQWQRKSAGAEEWQTVGGTNGAVLSFMAMLADDGAEYRVAVLKPDGSIAYGPSAAVTLAVGPMAVAEPDLAVSVAGGELGMTLKLPSGVSYQIEFSETLEEGSWEEVGEPLTGGDEPIFLTLPKTGDRGFYRLREIP